jgi:hypothetical protein
MTFMTLEAKRVNASSTSFVTEQPTPLEKPAPSLRRTSSDTLSSHREAAQNGEKGCGTLADFFKMICCCCCANKETQVTNNTDRPKTDLKKAKKELESISGTVDLIEKFEEQGGDKSVSTILKTLSKEKGKPVTKQTLNEEADKLKEDIHKKETARNSGEIYDL